MSGVWLDTRERKIRIPGKNLKLLCSNKLPNILYGKGCLSGPSLKPVKVISKSKALGTALRPREEKVN